MKQGVWIVNTSRGKVVDEKAMYEALISGRAAGYATDVFEHGAGRQPAPRAPQRHRHAHMAHTPGSLFNSWATGRRSRAPRLSRRATEFVVNPEVYDRPTDCE